MERNAPWLNLEFYHQTVTTKQIEDYLSGQAGLDLQAFFDQYLRDARIPILEYAIEKETIRYRWSNTIREFNMPIKVAVDGTSQWIEPTTGWSSLSLSSETSSFDVDPDFYVSIINLTGK